MKNTEVKLTAIINAVLENNDLPTVEVLNDDDNLRDDLQLDSLDLAELTVRLEEEFGVDIFQESLIETVGEIKNILKSKSNG